MRQAAQIVCRKVPSAASNAPRKANTLLAQSIRIFRGEGRRRRRDVVLRQPSVRRFECVTPEGPTGAGQTHTSGRQTEEAPMLGLKVAKLIVLVVMVGVPAFAFFVFLRKVLRQLPKKP